MNDTPPVPVPEAPLVQGQQVNAPEAPVPEAPTLPFGPSAPIYQQED